MTSELVRGWYIPSGGPRAWHYFSSESDLFSRLRSLCQARVLVGSPYLVDLPGVTRTPVCPRCEVLAPPLPAAPGALRLVPPSDDAGSCRTDTEGPS